MVDGLNTAKTESNFSIICNEIENAMKEITIAANRLENSISPILLEPRVEPNEKSPSEAPEPPRSSFENLAHSIIRDARNVTEYLNQLEGRSTI